ncbi:MAG: T9SS type A sorting domain-containing protein, partial [Bacteroidetes bacterium]|nr:T9SS type A sorting domain-containing protein [Bacteroidota bacterium]
LHADSAHLVVTNGTGRLRLVNGNAVNTYPVAASLTSPNFVTINNAGVQDNFGVRVVGWVLKNGNAGDTLRTAYVNRTWFIEEDVAGGSNATVTFQWNTADEQSGFDRSISKTAHYTSSWQLGTTGAATVEAPGVYSRTQAGYTSFSPFTVTSSNAVSLPLHLIRFDAMKQGSSNALLQWETSDEVNTSRFVVQHSTDGQQYEDIGTVAAMNRTGVNLYSFVHSSVSAGTHYYRLKMVDIDGSYTLSGVRTLSWENMQLMQVYPNPARQYVSVKGIAGGGMLEVLTADGRLLKQVATTGSSTTLDLGGLPGGIYIIVYRKGDVLQQQRIMKE